MWNNIVRHFFEKDTQEKVSIARRGAPSSRLLQRFIAPEQLPACFPGGKLALRGAPDCSCRINPGGKVPADPAAWRWRNQLHSAGAAGSAADEASCFFPDHRVELPEATLHPRGRAKMGGVWERP